MQLGKVELQQGGLKGLKVSYLEKVTRDGFAYYDEHPGVKIKTPLPAEMKLKFQNLKDSFLQACTLDPNLVEQAAVTITGIESDENEYFRILGQVASIYGDTLEVTHPLIYKNSGFKRFDKVMKEITAIYDMVSKYKNRQLHQTTAQMLLEFSKEERFSGYFAEVDIEKLSGPEQKAKAKEILEKSGCIVLDTTEDIEEPVS